jgi:anaerobic ribonucleoside-triphosphate reductase activating protein
MAGDRYREPNASAALATAVPADGLGRAALGETALSDRDVPAVQETLVVHSVDYRGSVVDGPGLRTVLFLQGCWRRCPGCHNPTTWDPAGGTIVVVAELVAELRARSLTRSLTISGGEPLLQAAGVLALVRSLPEYSMALYTGFDFPDVPSELLAHLAFVKVGHFDVEQCCHDVPFVGSRNQRFLRLRRDVS